MYIVGADAGNIRRHFARQPLPVLNRIRTQLAHSQLSAEGQAAYAVLLDVIASKSTALRAAI